MDYEKIFSKNTIGLPMKIKRRYNDGRISYIYGRYFGRGYDGNSNYNDYDYNLVTLVTPSSYLLTSDIDLSFPLTRYNEKKILIDQEKIMKKPYKYYLEKERDNYIKSDDYKLIPLSLNEFPLKWFFEKKFFEIDEDLFGNSLAKVFTKELGRKYTFQKLDAVRETKGENISNHNLNTKYISVISDKEYDGVYSHNVDITSTKKVNSLFYDDPLIVKENDFLIYFGNYLYRPIFLGKVDNDKISINTFNPIPYSDDRQQIIYNEVNYPFVKKFINEIINYKLQNRKMKIDESDMDVILSNFGIEKDIIDVKILQKNNYR